jgi:orotate phosphoribosyltransferase
VLPVEVYDLFAFVMTNTKSQRSSVVFLDLKGKLMFKSELLKAESCIMSVDKDQQRKDLIVGLETGRVLCCAAIKSQKSSVVFYDLKGKLALVLKLVPI